MIKSLFFIVFFLFFASNYAQEPIRYTVKNGLPSNHIYDIQQDNDGFMWFATNRGVVKFDGETFKTFTIKDGLPNNDIWLLEADKQGKIHYLTKSNYQGYIKNDSVYKFITPDSTVISPRFHKSNDKIWLTSKIGYLTIENKSLIKELDFKKHQEVLLKASEKHKFNIQKSSYNPESKETIIIDKDITVLDSIFSFLYKIAIPQKIELLNRNYIFAQGLLPDQIYYMSTDTGVLLINFNKRITKIIEFKEEIGQGKVTNVYCKSFNNEIQISGPNYLLIFNYEFELIRKYELNNQLGNKRNFQDKNGNIWQSSLNSGISLIPKVILKSDFYFKESKVQKLGKIKNNFFAGVFGDGFYEFNPSLNIFEKRIKVNPNSLISHIKHDSISNIDYFISSENSYRFSNKRKHSINYSFKIMEERIEYSLQHKDVTQFNGVEYALTTAYLLSYHGSNESGFAKVEAEKSGLKELVVFKRNLYVGGSDGLHIFNKHKGIVKPFIKNELLTFTINCMTATKTHLIVGTDGRGVYYYTDNEIIHLKDTDGLIIQKTIKNNNELWLATNMGVKKITLNKENLANSKITNSFYETDGLLQDNTNDIFIEDNTLYAASDIGLTKLNVNNPIYKKTPNLYFKTENDSLHFKNGERDNISISFSTLDYVNQNHLKYKYRLLPLQKEWITTTVKTLNFASLSPKLYHLEVKVTDQHNNEIIKTQYINVVPAWWQTMIAKIGFGFLALFGSWLVVQQIKNQIRKKEQEKAKQDKRISGLELQALRSQMNPHFVHNSLNAIQYYIQRNEVELSEDYLVKFSKLIRLFFEYSRRQNISIKDEVDLLINYLQIEQLRFEDKLDFIIQVDKKIDQEEQLLPSMILQPIVENAVNHGLFHKQEPGIIKINFNYIDPATFQVLVKDDGIGINKSKEIQKTSSKNYQSRSSAVLQERLDLLKQSEEWDIIYHIEDLSENNSTSGTMVTLTFNQPNRQ